MNFLSAKQENMPPASEDMNDDKSSSFKQSNKIITRIEDSTSARH